MYSTQVFIISVEANWATFALLSYPKLNVSLYVWANSDTCFIRALLNIFRQSQEENCILSLTTVSRTVSWVIHKNKKIFIFLLDTETKRKQKIWGYNRVISSSCVATSLSCKIRNLSCSLLLLGTLTPIPKIDNLKILTAKCLGFRYTTYKCVETPP